MRILLVDDVKENLVMLEILLKSAHHEVTLCNNGEDALNILRKMLGKEYEQGQGFEAVISDILMPKVDGFQLCHQIRNDPGLKDLIFIFYTATYIEEEDERFALVLGADAFIRKPLAPKELLVVLEKYFHRGFREHELLHPDIIREKKMLELYNERLVKKLDKKIAALRAEITKRQELERELLEKEKIMFHAQKLSHFCYFIWNIDQDVIIYSNYFQEIFGVEISKEHSSFEGFLTLIHPENVGEVRAVFKEMVTSKKIKSLTFRLSKSNFAEKIIQFHGQCVEESKNKKKRIIGSFIDITLLRKIDQMHIQIEKYNALTLFANSLAHDFNNILTVILGNVNMMQDVEENSASITACMKDVEEGVMKARALTQKFLSFTRISKPSIESRNIKDILENSLSFFKHAFSSKIVLEIDAEPLIVDVDPLQIDQVFNNLVLNSFHAMPNGGILNILVNPLQIEESSNIPVMPGDYVKITFEDHGIGMTSEQQKHIFEPYFTTKEKGTGLGLISCLKIIHEHKGYINFTSELGKGTKFNIYLPLSHLSSMG